MKLTRPTLSGAARLTLLAAVSLMQGCAQQKVWNGIYNADTVGGARSCVAPTASPPDGQAVQAQIQVSNEGGWCGITASRGGAPFDSYLLDVRPTHGKVFAHRVGGNTRIDYTPDRGFVGTDQFAVRLIPGNGVVQGAVTVAR